MWSSRARATLLLGLTLLVGGCGAKQGDGPGVGARRPLPDPNAGLRRDDPRLGLVSLPLPRQVTNAVPQGRLDPFSPVDPPQPAAARGATAAGRPVAAGSGNQTVPPPGSSPAGAPRTSAPAPESPSPSPAPRPGAPAAQAPSPAGPARPATPSVFSLPTDFAFTGVISSGGRVGALVQTGSDSGTVHLGETGNPGTPWLPQGWRVVGIDGVQGRLTLRRGATVRRLTLP